VSPRRKRRRGLLAAGLAVVVVAGGATAYLVTRGGASAASAQPQLQSAVARRTELRQTVDAQFTMTRSQSFTLRAPAGTVTGVHLTEGKALPSLQPLVELDGTAIYGIPSATPFYRDLAEGDSGNDVKALQAALESAGYDPGDSDGDFGGQTATALEDWQAAKGLDETGRMSLSQFVSFPPGSIALDVPVTVGDRLGGGGTIATVGGARSMVAQADVGQQDVVQLKTGQQAELSFDALPDTQVTARVSTIALDPEAQSSSAGTSAPVEYSVELRPTGLPRSVRAGMTGQVSVVVVDVRDAVVVPTAAVGGNGGTPTVQLLEDGRTRTVPVITGLATSSGVQILAGVQPGQTVVTGLAGSDQVGSGQTNQVQGGPFGGGGFLFGGGRGGGGAGSGGGGGRGTGGGNGGQGQGGGGNGGQGQGGGGNGGQGQGGGGP
jgi:macrolide-specific efflux system membrane fusion protein